MDKTRPQNCFCVDAFGQKIESFGDDPDSCDVKPFECPVMEADETISSVTSCVDDYRCVLDRQTER